MNLEAARALGRAAALGPIVQPTAPASTPVPVTGNASEPSALEAAKARQREAAKRLAEAGEYFDPRHLTIPRSDPGRRNYEQALAEKEMADFAVARATPPPPAPDLRGAHAVSLQRRATAMAEVDTHKAAKTRAENAVAAARTAMNQAAAAVEVAKANAIERAEAATKGTATVTPISLAQAKRDLEDREHEHEAAKAAFAGVDSKLGSCISTLGFREDQFARTRDAIIAAEVRAPLLRWYGEQCRRLAAATAFMEAFGRLTGGSLPVGWQDTRARRCARVPKV
jgi:hypothetical protein